MPGVRSAHHVLGVPADVRRSLFCRLRPVGSGSSLQLATPSSLSSRLRKRSVAGLGVCEEAGSWGRECEVSLPTAAGRPHQAWTPCQHKSSRGISGNAPHLVRKLRHAERAVLLAVDRSQGREADHEEVQPREGNQVDGQLAQIAVQLPCRHPLTSGLIARAIDWRAHLTTAQRRAAQQHVCGGRSTQLQAAGSSSSRPYKV